MKPLVVFSYAVELSQHLWSTHLVVVFFYHVWVPEYQLCESLLIILTWQCYKIIILTIHPSTGTKLCAERWWCLSSLVGDCAQSWTGHHSNTGYQQAGTHFATSEGWRAQSTPPVVNSTAEWNLNSGSKDPKPTTLPIKPTPGILVPSLI